MALVSPHGRERTLQPLLLEGEALAAERVRAETLPRVPISSRETCDAIMMGIGGFTPLRGFMGPEDWRGVCDHMTLQDGTFWPIPITVSTTHEIAAELPEGQPVALIDQETGTPIATMDVEQQYEIDKRHECRMVFGTDDPQHPGVAKVLAQGPVNLGGPLRVLDEGGYPEQFPAIYLRPHESRARFEELGWSTVAAFQTRNPMHRSHEYLCKIAIEVSDGIFIHQIIGKLKAGDIPADVRQRCIDELVEGYFRADTVVQGGYPLEMRYAGPREALLHAVFRQNYGCSHLIVGRDHAGVGSYYGPFDAQRIFHDLPPDALELQVLPIDWTFWCYSCGGMASMKTCPHDRDDRLLLSGTMVRKMLSEGGELPEEFSRPEVVSILQEYYQGLEQKVEIKLHRYATGEERA